MKGKSSKASKILAAANTVLPAHSSTYHTRIFRNQLYVFIVNIRPKRKPDPSKSE